MANSLGSLVVSLGLDAAEFTRGLSKAEYQAQQFGQGIQKQIDGVKKLAAALGAGISIAAFTNMIKGAIDAADRLNDLSKKTGVAVESLGGIGFAAKQAGGDLESVSGALGKLNKSLAEAAAGNVKAAEPFKAMGIAIKDAAGNTKDAGVVFAQIADKFQGYADGPEKVAIAYRTLGKAGADQIALLNDGGDALRKNIEYYKRYSGVTTETAKAADEFNDTLEKINLLSQAFSQHLAEALLPSLRELAKLWLENKEKGDQFKGVANDIATFLKALAVTVVFTASTFTTLGDQIGAFFAKLKAFGSGDMDAFRAISKAADENLEAARKRFSDFYDALYNPKAGESGTPGKPPPRKGPAPRLPGEDTSAGDVLKKQLDQQLKAIKDFAEARKSVLEFQSKYIEQDYKDGLRSLESFYEEDRLIREAALDSKQRAFDHEINALEEYKRKVVKPQDRIEAETKISEAIAKRALAEQKFNQDDAIAKREELRALQQVQDAYTDLLTTIKTLGGDTAGATKARIDQQVRDARLLSRQAGKSEPQADADAGDYRALLQNVADVSEAQKDYNKLLERTRDTEESLLLAAQASGATEMDTLRAVGSARQEALKQLSAMVDRANELALALGTPEAIRFAEELGMAFKRAAAEVDPLLLKIRDVGGDMASSIAGSFENMIAAGQSFHDTLKDIESQLLRILTRLLITQPFENWLKGLLGGNGQASGGGGLIGALMGGFNSAGSTGDYNALGALESQQSIGKGSAEGRAMALSTGQVQAPAPSLVQNINIGDYATRNDVMRAMTVAKEQAKAEILQLQRNGQFANA